MYKCLKCNSDTFQTNGLIVCSNEVCWAVHELGADKKIKLLNPQPKVKPLNPAKFNARDTITNELTPNINERFKDNLMRKAQIELTPDFEYSFLLRNKLLHLLIDTSLPKGFSDNIQDYKKIEGWEQRPNGMARFKLTEKALGEYPEKQQKILFVLE